MTELVTLCTYRYYRQGKWVATCDKLVETGKKYCHEHLRAPKQYSIELSKEECLVCDRIGIATYYRELREVGFTRDFALKTLKVLAQIYFKDHPFFAGKSRGTIKGGVAYAVYVYRLSLHSNLEVLRIRSDRGVGTGKATMILGLNDGTLDEKKTGQAIRDYNESKDTSEPSVSSTNQALLAWKFNVSAPSLRTMYQAIYANHQVVLGAVCGAK